MSKKLKALLENLKVENVEETYNALMDDESDNQEIIDSILTGAQTYARPFIEAELNATFGEERKSHKGKYMKEAVLLANKEFGSMLTNSEIEKVMSDPANKDKTINAVFKLLKEKALSKDGNEPNEIRNMLDLANQKIAELEQENQSIEAKFQTKYEADIHQYKLDGVLSKELVRVLEGKTSIPAAKAANLIKKELGDRAVLRLDKDGRIGLFDKSNENSPLKKSDTQVYNFDALVEDIANDYELIQKSGGGEILKPGGEGGSGDGGQAKLSGLAAKMEAVTS